MHEVRFTRIRKEGCRER